MTRRLFIIVYFKIQSAIAKLTEEIANGMMEGDIFEQEKVNRTHLDGLYRTAIKVHDQTLVSLLVMFSTGLVLLM